MDKKKIIILAVIIILIAGLGIFVFANPSTENLNDNNNTNNSTQNGDNENLDDENTNGEEEEGVDSNKQNTGNNGSDNNDNDESQNPSTSSEPTIPSVPEEPAVDTSYEDALVAVIKAESSLSQTDVDSALALVNVLADGNDKTGLASRVQAVQNMINAISAVELAEETFTQGDVNIANALINSLSDSENKTDLTNRINAVQNAINVASLVTELQEKTESATDKISLEEARKFRIDEDIVAKVGTLGESIKKDELIKTLDTLALILDDNIVPIVSGILNNAIINDTSVILITDTNEVTILLNNKLANLEDLTQNTLVDGEYTLMVTDAAFNSSEAITFEVDKTKPKVDGLDNGYVVNKTETVTISDEHLVSVTLNGELQDLSDTGLSYTKNITSNGTYHFVAKDEAGNVTEFTILMDSNISSVIEIDSEEDLVSAINNQQNNQYWIIHEGIYNLYQGSLAIYEDDMGGQTRWFLPIVADNLTIVGDGNVTLKAGEAVLNGAIASQNFVTIFGDNVKVSNLTLVAQVDLSDGNPNKVVEIYGDNAVLTNITVNPDTSDSTDFAGSICINKKGITTTLTNVILNKGRIILSGADNTNLLKLNNVKVDFAGSNIEGVIDGVTYAPFYNPNGTVVEATDFTVTITNKLASVMNDVLAVLPNGTKVELADGEYEVGSLDIQNQIFLEGSSLNTVLKVSDVISNQASIYISNNGSISNMKIESINDYYAALKVSGNSLKEIEHYTISNIEIIGGKTGINIHGVKNAIVDGVSISENSAVAISVASSYVTITNSNLAAGGWGMAIGIMYDPDNKVSYPIPATVKIGSGNMLETGVYAEYYEDDNDFDFQDDFTGEIVYDGNQKKYFF